jgi:type VI secretion system FHA domain protein
LGDFVRVAPAEDSLDDLFGLGPGSSLADPLAKAMPVPAGPPNMGAHSDPLVALGRAPSAPPATEGNLGSELNTPMPLARPAPMAAPPPAAPARSTLPPSTAVFSWDEPAGGTDAQRRAERAAPIAKTTALPRPPAAAKTASDTAPPGADALRAALLEGLAAPALRIDELTPQTMRLIGQLLHEATRGTVELLLARAALKREIRAEVTMIVTRENNPLKFSPTVDVALQHLLGAPTPGFLPGAAAMRDAYDDLRAHQLGVMAGMRAALDGVLQRFDPAHLESDIAGRASIGSLFAMGRKAKLWELFQELFSQLQSEAQDNFDELFGKAFLQAYEQHIDRLRDGPGPG